MTLSQKIKNARLSRKISQKTLAEALGVSRSTLSAWESGAAVPSVLYIRKYQELFGFPRGFFDDAVPQKTSAESISFDTSYFNRDGVDALQNFYNSLLLKEEYLKKS